VLDLIAADVPAGCLVKDLKANARWWRYRPPVLVAETAHPGALRLLDTDQFISSILIFFLG
jgi:hypothetical protein